MAAPVVPPYDLSKLPSVYPDPATLRAAYLNLARWAHKSERFEDMARIMREVVRASCAGLLGPTPTPNSAILMAVSGMDTIATQTQTHGHAGFMHQHYQQQPQNALPPVTTIQPQDPHDVSAEERQLLFLAYKNIMSSLRAAWRAIHIECTTQAVNQKLGTTNNTAVSVTSAEAKLIDEYRCQLEREILMVCTDLTSLLEQTLIAIVQQPEAKVYYLKLAGDFYRYLAEVHSGITCLGPKHLYQPSDRAVVSSIPSIIPAGYDKKSMEYYSAAHKIALQSLDPCHPSRLGLCCNYSVLLYEIFDEPKQACELARQSFDAAIARLDEMDESHYREATLTMQLLRDNITLWTAQTEGEQQQM